MMMNNGGNVSGQKQFPRPASATTKRKPDNNHPNIFPD